MDFYDFEEYEQLIAAARKRSLDHLAFLLLGGDAGLHWTSVDLRRRLITVECSEYKGEFTTPKHDKIRTVPMTMRLAAALAARRGGSGPLVFSKADDCRSPPARGSRGSRPPSSGYMYRTRCVTRSAGISPCELLRRGRFSSSPGTHRW
jgi:hypothetical protein